MSLFKDLLPTIINDYNNKIINQDEFDSINNAELKKIMTENELADFEQAFENLTNKSHVENVVNIVSSYYITSEDLDDKYAQYFHHEDGEISDNIPYYNSVPYIEVVFDLPYETLLPNLIIQKAVTAFTAAIVQTKDYREDVMSGELKMGRGILTVKNEAQQFRNKAWKATLREAFAQNANKVVSDEQYETLFEIQAGYSLEEREKIALENIDDTVPVETTHADYQAKIDAVLSSVGDGSMGVYASDQTAKLYSHVRYIEFFQNYDDTLSILPVNIAEKLATAVACALKHSKDYSADVKSGALKPLAPGTC